MGGLDDATRPLRYVFDEGHHLFDAADGAFGAHLSGVEASDLRRWLLGAEGRRGSRARGLERRVSDLLGEDVEAQNALRRLLDLAQQLPCHQLADAAGRRHGAGPGRGVPGAGAPAGACAVGRRRPGFRPGMRRAAAQSRADRGGRPARRDAGEDAAAGATAAPGAAREARRRGRQARLQPALAHRRLGAVAHQPLRTHARILARHVARPARRCRSRLRRLVRRGAHAEPRIRRRHVPPLSRPRRAVRECGDPARSRRGHHIGHAARFARRSTGRQRRGCHAPGRLDGRRGAHRHEASRGRRRSAPRWPRRSTMPMRPRCWS